VSCDEVHWIDPVQVIYCMVDPAVDECCSHATYTAIPSHVWRNV